MDLKSDSNVIWVRVYDHYEIGSNGDCISYKGKEPKLLCKTPNDEGYIHYRLRVGGETKSFKAHRLVAKAFLGDSPQVNHINGIRSDNRLENLELSDNSHNQKHAFRELGKSVSGEKNPRAKLRESDVIEIRRLGATKIKRKDLANMFGVSLVTIEKILGYKIWRNVCEQRT